VKDLRLTTAGIWSFEQVEALEGSSVTRYVEILSFFLYSMPSSGNEYVERTNSDKAGCNGTSIK